MRCDQCGSEKDGAICWTCAVNRLPKESHLGHVSRANCRECGYDAPVWVDSDEWLCRVCKLQLYPDLNEEE